MRRTAILHLTLLPLLASAGLARAQAPGETEPGLSPPGMTPIRGAAAPCVENDGRPECRGASAFGGFRVRTGGFGHYFGTGGG